MASALFNYAHVNILSLCIQFCTSLECMMYQSSLLVTKLNEQKSEYLFYMIKGSTVHYKTEQIREIFSSFYHAKMKTLFYTSNIYFRTMNSILCQLYKYKEPICIEKNLKKLSGEQQVTNHCFSHLPRPYVALFRANSFCFVTSGFFICSVSLSQS